MAKLTHKQKKFANHYIETGNGTQSALKAYDTKSEIVAASIGTENLRKPKVIEYLESKAENAAIRVVELSNQGENLNVALGASRDILDRAGYKPVEKSVNLTVSVEANMSDEEKALVEDFENKLKESI